MKAKLFFWTLIFVLLALPSMVAFAQTPVPPTPPDLATLVQAALTLFMSLVGFPAALAAVLALVMKFVPGVTAEVAGWISFAANALFFLVIAYLVYTGQSAIVASLDSLFGGLADILAKIIVVLGGFGISFLSTAKYTRAIAEHGSAFRAARMLYHPKP